MKTKLLIVLVCLVIYIPSTQSQCVTVPNQNTVYGTVFNDVNQNGNHNGSENGINNVSLNLYQDFNSNGVIDSEDFIIDTTTSNSSGEYTLEIPRTIISNNVTDFFNSISFNGNDGSEDWSNYWQEIGESNGATLGNVQVTNNGLRFGDVIPDNLTMSGDGVDRIVDLSTYTSASLTFNFDRFINSNVGQDFTVNVQISTDGINYSTLESLNFSSIVQSYTYDISSYINATTHIRFVASGSREEVANYLLIDAVNIEYSKVDISFPDHIVTIDMTTAPSGYSLTSNLSEIISFTSFGQFNCDNDFGLFFCSGFCNPVAEDDFAIVDQGESVSISVLDNDTDGNSNIDAESLFIVSEPLNGSVVLDDTGSVIYSPNGSYVGTDSFQYEICDNTIPIAFCDTATVNITINENLIDPCFQAIQDQTYFVPFSDDDLRTALINSSSTACSALLTNEVNRVISIKNPYPGTKIIYDHWEDGYEVDITNPTQASTQVWGDEDLSNGITPEYEDDFIPSGGDIVLENTYNYNPRNSSDIFFDGKDKIYTSNDISLSVIAGDVEVFYAQLAKTDVYNIDKFGTSFTVPFGEDLGQEFQYTGLFVRASNNNTTVNIDIDNDGVIDITDTIDEGEVTFVDGGVNSGALVTSNQPVGVDLFFGGLDCFGTRQINIYPGKFYSDTYYSPTPTRLSTAPSVVYFYNSLNRSININWQSNSNNGVITVPAKSSSSIGLNDDSGYKFKSQGGESYVASQVVDSDANEVSSFDWAFNLIAESRLTDFASIAWAPGNIDNSANYNPVWVTPVSNTTLYIKYDGNIEDSNASLSPCGIPYDETRSLNALNYTQIFDTFNNDNDQSGLAIYTCDGTKIFAVYGEDPALAPPGEGAIDVGTTIQPMCLNPLVFAKDDSALALTDTPVGIPVFSNDSAFLATLNLASISTDDLIQPENGVVSVDESGTITYTPNSGFTGTDQFQYSICLTEFPNICDIAWVTIKISECASPSDKNFIYGQVFFDLNEDTINNDDLGVEAANVKIYNDGDNNGLIGSNDKLLSTVATNKFGFYNYEIPVLSSNITDNFSSFNYTSGTGVWSSNWIEVGDDNNSLAGDVRIEGSRSLLRVVNNSEIYRSADLSGVSKARLYLRIREYGRLESSDDVLIEFCSNDTFSNCQTIFAKANDFRGANIYAFELDSDKLTANSTLRIKTNGYTSSDGAERLYVDNINITYESTAENLVLETDLSSLPPGYTLSTDNIEVVNITSGSYGNCLKNNDFGLIRCNLTESGLMFYCNDNGTPGDASDDFYNITLDPVGTRLGASYTVSGDISGTGTYGVPSSFGPFLVSDGTKTITISDNTGSCTLEDIEISVSQYSCLSLTGNSTLDFDGVDDYLSGSSLVNNLANLTVMAWIKIDPTNAGNPNAAILSEDRACHLYVSDGNDLQFRTITDNSSSPVYTNGERVKYNEWHHVTGTFSSATGIQSFYIDGQLVSSRYSANRIGHKIKTTDKWNGNFEIGRFSRDITNKQYFNGEIDEVRVFNKTLSESQIQNMIYQEIEDNNGFVRGKIIPKDIKDLSTNQSISWNDLIAYYPMSDIKDGKTSDYSGKYKDVTLHNITTIQEQTAPMPYITRANGSWTQTNTWLHGGVWDIEDVSDNKGWSIVDIRHNVATSSSHTNLGLFIDSNKKLTLTGDHKLENTWYLELDGTLDLQDDSQLIQTINSDLVTSATGKLLRRQEGHSSVYRYNYWSSPVGSLGATTLSNNNGNSNNGNNATYRANMLKKPNGSNFQFTSAYHETGKLSTRWMYTYINGVTYYDWAYLNPNTALQPGLGYTTKGTGVGSEQQYVFEGKPNNGTIVIPVVDTGGNGSVPAVSKTDYLFGNPYASAIDLHKFIDDNVGVIDGTIQLWQQWSGNSHNLDEYDGGYAQVNKTGATRAYQFVGIEGANNGNQDGTKIPTRYLPVGQGFMTEIVTGGNVVFRNSQRVFVKESDANGSYTTGSVFFRNGSRQESTQEDTTEEASVMQKLRLEFNSVDGPATKRELLLGFSEQTTDAFDYGYEAKNVEVYNDDLNLVLGDELMTIQAYTPITEEKVVSLSLKASGSYNYTIHLTETEHIPEDQNMYIRDNLTNTYYDLRSEEPFEFSSDTGDFSDRLEVVFQTQSESLSIDDETIETIKFYYAISRNKIVILNPKNEEIKGIQVINMLGQSVYDIKNVFEGSYNEYDVRNLSTGTYIIKLNTTTNEALTKKIIIK